MSQQLDKLELEKQALEAEVAALEKAMAPEEAAKKIVEAITAKPDPLTLDNEWVAPGGNGCCAVM